jgi:hypothetical protein
MWFAWKTLTEETPDGVPAYRTVSRHFASLSGRFGHAKQQSAHAVATPLPADIDPC